MSGFHNCGACITEVRCAELKRCLEASSAEATPEPAGTVGSLAQAPGSAFVREPRYLVVKIKDANQYLTLAERDTLERLWAKCAIGRIDNDKPPLECVVVESDWPEYGPTWAALEARMTSLNAEISHDQNGEPKS